MRKDVGKWTYICSRDAIITKASAAGHYGSYGVAPQVAKSPENTSHPGNLVECSGLRSSTNTNHLTRVCFGHDRNRYHITGDVWNL